MPQTIVNLTLPVVLEKINQILITYPQRPYQERFAAPELRQKLTAYVLSRLPVVYVTMEDIQACTLDSPSSCYSHGQHEQIEQLIHQGIDSLMVHHSALGQLTGNPISQAAGVPSNWFG
jgi:hypothetical protein